LRDEKKKESSNKKTLKKQIAIERIKTKYNTK
jgi:hypothetical protein